MVQELNEETVDDSEVDGASVGDKVYNLRKQLIERLREDSF